MIASLRGTLAAKAEGHCVIEAGGVGYAVNVSSHTLRVLPERGEPVFVLTRQVVREDSLALFGFAEERELRLFDLLIAVSGVGPKLALTVLSGLDADSLARAIRKEQVAALVAIPGIGRKTAERLVVELRDKLDPVGAAEPARDGALLPRGERYQDAVAALQKLGYSPSQAQEAVRRAGQDLDDPSLEDLVRLALARLGKGAVVSR